MKTSSANIIAQLRDQNARLFAELTAIKNRRTRLYKYQCGEGNDLMYSEDRAVNGGENSGFLDVLIIHNEQQP